MIDPQSLSFDYEELAERISALADLVAYHNSNVHDAGINFRYYNVSVDVLRTEAKQARRMAGMLRNLPGAHAKFDGSLHSWVKSEDL